MSAYRIVVDDEDRGPDDYGKPWTASLFDANGQALSAEAGLGASPAEAVAELLRQTFDGETVSA